MISADPTSLTAIRLGLFVWPVVLCIISAGIFLMTGLLTGVWKYRKIMTSETARAPYYVDIAHRSSLMYSFAALLLAVFAGLSRWPQWVNGLAASATLIFFAMAITSYVVHGLLRDTTNQLRQPFTLGPFQLPRVIISLAMWLLIVAEVAGTAVLFAGTLAGLE